jgi:hypothetical protein
MSDTFFCPHRRISDSQTAISKKAVFDGDGIREIASDTHRISDVQSYGKGISEITRREELAREPLGLTSRDRKQSYPLLLRAMAWIGAVTAIIGIIIGISVPGPVTGAFLPFGLILFSLAGWLARRQDNYLS